MVGQQRESVECVSFCLFMVHELEETKKAGTGQSAGLCLYFISSEEKGTCLFEAMLSGNSLILQTLLQWLLLLFGHMISEFVEVCFQRRRRQKDQSWIWITVQKLWNIGRFVYLNFYNCCVWLQFTFIHWHGFSWQSLGVHGWYLKLAICSLTEAVA